MVFRKTSCCKKLVNFFAVNFNFLGSKRKKSSSPFEESVLAFNNHYAKQKRKIQLAKKELTGLWANTCVDLLPEKEYNLKMGKLFPHCCVCQYFLPQNFWIKKEPTENLPRR